MINDLVSIIIPAYKAEKYIQEALDSVSIQTYINWEVIVVEDGYTDCTNAIVNKFASLASKDRVKYLKHRLNQGLGATRNTGIREANGKYIAFLDHDDVWQSNHLETLLFYLEKEKADIVFAKSALFTDDTNIIHGYVDPSQNEWEKFPISLLWRNFIVPSATLVKKSSLVNIGLMSEDRKFHGCEDLYCWLELALHGYKFAYTKQDTCYYRKHSEAMTSKSIKGLYIGVSEQKLNVLAQYTNSKTTFSKEARVSASEIAVKLGHIYLYANKDAFKGLMFIYQSLRYNLWVSLMTLISLEKKSLMNFVFSLKVKLNK